MNIYKTSENKTEIDVIMTEYQMLMREKHMRMEHRLKLIVFNLTAVGALLAVGIQHNKLLILLVPFLSSLIGLLTIYHTVAVYGLARHVGSKIDPRVKDVDGNSLLTWDAFGIAKKNTKKGNPHFLEILNIFHLPILLSFVVPSVTALILFEQLYADEKGFWIRLVECMEGILILYLIVCYIWYNHIARQRKDREVRDLQHTVASKSGPLDA